MRKQTITLLTISSFIFFYSPLETSAGNFDGTWSFRITTTHGPCFAAPGTVAVNDGKIKGTVKGVNETLKVSGKISDNGKVKGRISKGLANFRGDISGSAGKIKWSGRGGCKGTINMRKN